MNNSFIKDWFVSTILTFVIYESLWNLLIVHSWDIQKWSVVFFDLFYCGVFVAVSIKLGRAICKLRYFEVFTIPRQLYLCTIIFVSNMVLAALFEVVYDKLLPADTEDLYHDGVYLFCFIASMLTSIHNIGYYYTIIATQKEQLFALQRQTLRNKLDPHFVFNSLSILTELIHQEPKQAELYCVSFAHLYRNTLINIDNDYISLNDSLSLVQEYVNLQQYRIAGKIELEIVSFTDTTDEYLFPLALQTLVENAIKHNTPSAGEVLTITISRNGNNIIVGNNITKNSNPATSFGIGLQTLYLQYKMEKLPEPLITYNKETFEVRILILKKKKSCTRF